MQSDTFLGVNHTHTCGHTVPIPCSNSVVSLNDLKATKTWPVLSGTQPQELCNNRLTRPHQPFEVPTQFLPVNSSTGHTHTVFEACRCTRSVVATVAIYSPCSAFSPQIERRAASYKADFYLWTFCQYYKFNISEDIFS